MNERRVVPISTHTPRDTPPAEGWRGELVYNRTGRLEGCHYNLDRIFENDEALKGLFGLDEFANRIVMLRDPPWPGKAGEWDDTDGANLASWLGAPNHYGMNARTGMVCEMVEAVARRHAFHPVRDFLTPLRWDGTPRLTRLLVDYFGAEDGEYTRRVSEIFMLSAVARILTPGCKVDTMTVLEGLQGAGKTRAVQALFGGDRWYMDAQRSPQDKDFYQELVGKWGVEIGEMTVFSKAEHNRVKQTLSATADTYRPSYGRYARTFPRQCIFVGTTNEDEYLRDPTGARRYLPVRVSVVQVDKLQRDREQLWAEAVSRFRAGEQWWQLPERADLEQEARYLEDAWESPIARWLSGGKVENYPQGINAEEPYEGRPMDVGRVRECTTYEVLGWALHIDTGRQTRSDQMRVSAIFRAWKWEKERVIRDGVRVRVWTRPPAET